MQIGPPFSGDDHFQCRLTVNVNTSVDKQADTFLVVVHNHLYRMFSDCNRRNFLKVRVDSA